MNVQDVSLQAPHFICEAGEKFCSENRKWQSAPSAAMTEKGRIFCVFSGDNVSADETVDNYTICGCSDDGGKSFRPVFYAYHDHEVRMSETLLFMSPKGVLYHFWTQSYRYFDGRGGIWCCRCEDPDAEKPVFGEPVRICDGFMADNPTVLKSGRWLFPASVWTHIKSEFRPFPEYEKACIWASDDEGESLHFVGGVHTPVPDFTENTVFEKENGTLVMLFRTKRHAGGINVSESADGGSTWSEAKPFVLDGPASRFMVSRFPSGALVMITHYHFDGRNNLTALLSDDDGRTFPHSLLLDERSDVSYPSGNITKDGRAIVAYDRERTGAREVMLASFTEEDIRNGAFGEGSYTKKIVAVGGEKGFI
ncbi:MAG: exo-alpha-sialidase [Oscillospiraceae bacterium]|nr:exo-alpha-sialidase [Oscillospiraceae bacterium]